MKINEIDENILKETTAGATSAGAIATVVNPKPKKQKKKKDGTVANAQDTGDNLLGGTAVRR